MVVPGGIRKSEGRLEQDERGERFETLRQLLILPRWLSLPPGSTWRPCGRGSVGWLVSRDRSQGQHTQCPRREAAKIPPGTVAQTTVSVTDPSSALLLMRPPSLPGGLTEPRNHKSLS